MKKLDLATLSLKVENSGSSNEKTQRGRKRSRRKVLNLLRPHLAS